MPLTFNFGEENHPSNFEGKPRTPVTLISGFLGTGKTSLLKHLLENQDGVRIGVVVNDVAAVNIDSQLVKRYEGGLVEVTELQNGCVCCSSADDLFTAVQTIVQRSKFQPFEHIVVELSGVGEPEAVKRNWTIGLECTMPVALQTEIKRVVTVVDASTFGADWLDTRQAVERNEARGSSSGGESEARHDEKNVARLENVGQLLAEQVEWASVVVVNKTDLASEAELRTTEAVVRALNPHCSMEQASFGKVAPAVILPVVPRGLKTAAGGSGDGYSWSQSPADMTVRLPVAAAVKAKDVDVKVGKQTLRMGLRGEKLAKVEGKLSGELTNLDDCLWELEGSGIDRCVVATLEKRKTGMWVGLWSQDDSSGAGTSSTAVPAMCPASCSDPSHGHHGHHGHQRLTATQRFGIHSFSFQRRRPFSSERLQKLLRVWPTPTKSLFSLHDLEPVACSDVLERSLRPILRSKGFCWVDADPLRCQSWSHAGRTLSVQATDPSDWWWAALDPEQLKFKITYPGVEAEYKALRKTKWDKDWGDRRQELVFIGGEQMSEEEILPLLEDCLLTDEEFADYKERSKLFKVPNDDFHVNGLLKNLGATEEQMKDLNAKSSAQQEKHKEEERLRRKRDREDTEFLRSLGVGDELEENAEVAGETVHQEQQGEDLEVFEAID